MKHPGISRRTVLRGTGVVLAGRCISSTRVLADAPPAEPVTPALIEAAKKEGQVIYYTSTDLPVAEKLAKASSRRNIRASRFASNVPAPSACFSGSARNIPKATFMPSTW